MKWIKDIEPFIRDNNQLMNNRQMAELFGCAPSTVSWIRCRLGLKKMEMEYWTPVMVKWLRYLYTWMGDYEIALIFDEAYPKAKGWTLKHIEKKRNYLGLHRSKEQLRAIKARNKAFGCWMVGSVHAWETRGQNPVGAVVEWFDTCIPHIKTEAGYERLSRHTWKKHNGPIPKGMNIVLKDHSKPANDPRNLECITNAELAIRNSKNRVPADIREAMNVLHQLNKRIKKLNHEK